MTPEMLAALTTPISRGEDPRTPAQLERFLEKRLDFYFPRLTLLKLQTADPDTYALAFGRMVQLDQEARENNVFNTELANYRAAVARLARYPLAEGRAEVYEDQPTDEYDENGEPILAPVLVQTAIPPLIAEDVEYPVIDPETGEQTGTVTEPDRDIVAALEKDAAERAAKQAIVDATPDAVKAFEG